MLTRFADRLLDALMRGADLACQVSTREGFEIKVQFPPVHAPPVPTH